MSTLAADIPVAGWTGSATSVADAPGATNRAHGGPTPASNPPFSICSSGGADGSAEPGTTDGGAEATVGAGVTGGGEGGGGDDAGGDADTGGLGGAVLGDGGGASASASSSAWIGGISLISVTMTLAPTR
jgi:hypothetical protein